MEHDSLLSVEWFQANYMKLNEEKCHFLITGHKHELLWLKTGRSKIWESEKQNLLGIVIDQNLRFNEYILSQCKNAGRKLSVLVRIYRFMTIKRRSMLMKALCYWISVWLLFSFMDMLYFLAALRCKWKPAFSALFIDMLVDLLAIHLYFFSIDMSIFLPLFWAGAKKHVPVFQLLMRSATFATFHYGYWTCTGSSCFWNYCFWVKACKKIISIRHGSLVETSYLQSRQIFVLAQSVTYLGPSKTSAIFFLQTWVTAFIR